MQIRQREIYLTSAPFSDYSKTKFRPVLAVSKGSYNDSNPDVLVCVVTTDTSLPYEVIITNKEMEKGKLLMDSAIRADAIFRLSKEGLSHNIGRVKEEAHKKVVEIITGILG